MATRDIGVILSGVTGRMGTNQHLHRSIMAIREQGGVTLSNGDRLMPVPTLMGRNADKLKRLGDRFGGLATTTDLDGALGDAKNEIFFDASGTQFRKQFVERAVAAGKSVYCEKPTATRTEDALSIARTAEDAGVRNGVVMDKLWLPGIRKLKMLLRSGFFGDLLDARGDFGYWVFSGHDEDQPAQRPSWNYRRDDGGGIVVDMHCHWRYLLDHTLGEVTKVFTHTRTLLPERIKEDGTPYAADADDAAYAIFEANGIPAQFNSSWATRVRRDDLFTLQVNGTKGSAVATLRDCRIQSGAATPKPVWNPDIDQPIDFYDGWQRVPDATSYDNAFKVQWELFLRHHAGDLDDFPYTLREGAKGVQLADLSLQSSEQGCWKDVPPL